MKPDERKQLIVVKPNIKKPMEVWWLCPTCAKMHSHVFTSRIMVCSDCEQLIHLTTSNL